jgi:two-component system response regulator AtoC
MERAAVLADGPTIDAAFFRRLLPASERDETGELPVGLPLKLKEAVESFERRLIERALEATGDNKARAARLLGVSERTLWNKLKKGSDSPP